MELQKTILNQYMLLNNKPSIRKIASDTGIQMTRVFRILNGSKMKLNEFQIFQQKVREMMGLKDSLESLAAECSLKLSPDAIREIENLLKRKIDLWMLKNHANKDLKALSTLTA